MMTDNTEFDDLVGKKSRDVNESGNGEGEGFHRIRWKRQTASIKNSITYTNTAKICL